MKSLYKIIFLIFIPVSVFAQTENINTGKYHPAKEVFEKKYEIQNHSKFIKSQIQIFSNKVVLDNIRSISFSEKIETMYKLIMENGLLDPHQINGSFTIEICCFDELKLLNPNPKTKRFKFWIFPKNNRDLNTSEVKKLSNAINPSEYYFELQNENATEKTSYEDFISGAKLTFITFGTIII